MLFRSKYGLEDKYVVLGVAANWSKRKGLPVFVELARSLDTDRFAVVVVGLSDKQIKQVKKQTPVIVALPRTDSQDKLAEVYSAADVLVNPSAEETYGMNVAEAAACGTGAIVVEGSACAEVADPKKTIAIQPSLATLEETILRLARLENR